MSRPSSDTMALGETHAASDPEVPRTPSVPENETVTPAGLRSPRYGLVAAVVVALLGVVGAVVWIAMGSGAPATAEQPMERPPRGEAAATAAEPPPAGEPLPAGVDPEVVGIEAPEPAVESAPEPPPAPRTAERAPRATERAPRRERPRPAPSEPASAEPPPRTPTKAPRSGMLSSDQF